MYASALLPHEIDSLPIGERIKATLEEAIESERQDAEIEKLQDECEVLKSELYDLRYELTRSRQTISALLGWLEHGEGSDDILAKARAMAAA